MRRATGHDDSGPGAGEAIADPPSGVTRYRRRRRLRSQSRTELLIAGLFLPLGVFAVAVGLFDSAPVVAATLLAVCVAVPPTTVVLPWLLRPVVIVAPGVGVLAWAAAPGTAGRGHALCWLVGTLCGVALLAALARRRQRREIRATAEGAPPLDVDPSNGRDVGVFATWRDGEYFYEAADPSPEVVLDAVRALNGVERNVVSVFHGLGRLDVGGDAGDRLVVIQSDDRRKWHMVQDPHQPDVKQPMVVADTSTHYPRRRTTTLPYAERAVAAWVQRGERDPGLDWWDDTASDQAFRPRSLSLDD